MPDQELLDVARAAAEAAKVPRFDDLVQRAQRRRRNFVVAVGVGVSTLLTAALFGVQIQHDEQGAPASSHPTQHQSATAPTSSPSVSPRPSRSAKFLRHHPRALVHQSTAQVVDLSYANADHAAALWETCPGTLDGPCPEAIAWTADAWKTSQVMAVAGKVALYPLVNGSIVVWLYGAHSFVIEPDGSTRSITTSKTRLAAPPTPPLTNLPSLGGIPPGMYDPATATVYPPLTAPSTRCVYDDQWDARGRIWEYGASHCGPAKTTVAWSSDLGATWSTYDPGPGRILGLAVTTNRTAVIQGNRRADGTQSYQRLDVTSNGGHTWRTVRLPPQVGTGADMTMVTGDERLLLSDGETIWVANQHWTGVHELARRPTNVASMYFGGKAVVGEVSPTRWDVSTDAGTTWHPVTPRP